jgi:hypothetical protein
VAGKSFRLHARIVLLGALLAGCAESIATEPPDGPDLSIDLCEGLVSDRDPHPMTALDLPAAGTAVSDPEFGTTLRRITAVGDGGVLKPMYSTIPAWNADESYLILYHTGDVSARHELYDGTTYQFIKVLNIRPADLEQIYWDTSDPEVLYYVNRTAKTFVRHNVETESDEVLHTFSCPGDVTGGNDPMFTSWDSEMIGLMCWLDAAQREIFSFNIATLTEGPRAPTDAYMAPQAGASGSLFYFMGDVLDPNMSVLRSLVLANPLEHASIGRLANGRDTYNEVAFDGENIGSLVTHDLSDGSVRVIIGPATGYPYPPSGTHVSAVAYRSPGWVSISSVGATPDGQDVLAGELYIADTNPDGTGKVCRVAHHRSWGGSGPQGYWAEPHVVPSPSGSRLLFGSDWGGRNAVDAFIAELPSYRPAP